MALTIGQVARRAGVGVDTVRFYERAGLLRTPARTASGYRLYDEAGVARLRFIRRAKALGFTLDEIAELLSLNDARGRRSAVRALARKRLDDINSRIRELDGIRRTLGHLVHQCHGDGPLDGCPIIETVLSSPDAEPRAGGPARRAAA